jgi:hypothetical protein
MAAKLFAETKRADGAAANSFHAAAGEGMGSVSVAELAAFQQANPIARRASAVGAVPERNLGQHVQQTQHA